MPPPDRPNIHRLYPTPLSPNAPFERLIQMFGFKLLRSSGSHRIFSHPDVQELLNLQDVRGVVKPYQVRQFLRLVECYDVKLESES